MPTNPKLLPEERVTAAEANRDFSRLLRGVREGRSYLITSHARPVARMMPVTDDRFAEQAHAALLERLEKQEPFAVPRWTRDELYDDDV